MSDLIPVPDLETIHDTMVRALDGAKFSDGTILTCSSDTSPPSQGNLPHLMLFTGSFQAEEYSQWVTKIIWDIPGLLRVTGEASQPGKAIRRGLSDLFRALTLIRGLPIDDKGCLAPYGPNTVKLSFDDKLSFLAFRGGPVLRQVQVLPENPSDPFATANLFIHVEFLINQEPEEVLHKVSLVSLGLNVFEPARRDAFFDPTKDYTPPIPPLEDWHAQSGFAKPATVLTYGGQILTASNPPIPPDLPMVEGDAAIGLPSYTQQAIADGATLLWEMSQPPFAGTITDVTGHGNDGQFQGGTVPSFSPGLIRTYASVPDSNSISYFTNGPQLTIPAEFTVQFVYLFHGGAGQNFNDWGMRSTGPYGIQQIADNRYAFYPTGNGGTALLTPPGALVTGTRYHMAFVIRSGLAEIWINGSLASGPTNIGTNPGAFRNMVWSPFQFWDGQMQGLTYYPSALSSSTLQLHYVIAKP